MFTECDTSLIIYTLPVQLKYDLIHVPDLDVSFDFLLSSFLFSTTVTKEKVAGDHSVLMVT
jgi:hypothetical protein